jgi:hypothetical protein
MDSRRLAEILELLRKASETVETDTPAAAAIPFMLTVVIWGMEEDSGRCFEKVNY